MLTFEEVAMSPVEIACKWKDGTTDVVSLPRLRMRDYSPWLKEETEARKADGRKTIPKGLTPQDLWRVQTAIEREQGTLNDIWRKIQADGGAERVIDISLNVLGIPVDLRKRVKEIIPPLAMSNLAQELSGLFDLSSAAMPTPAPSTGAPAPFVPPADTSSQSPAESPASDATTSPTA